MLTFNGYSLFYHPKQNTITILLPQTSETLTNTVSEIAERRTDVKESELLGLLIVADYVFRKDKSLPSYNVYDGYGAYKMTKCNGEWRYCNGKCYECVYHNTRTVASTGTSATRTVTSDEGGEETEEG